MNDDELTRGALRFDKVTYEAACALVKSAPLSLTEHHFDQLAIISTKSEHDAREAQRQAQLVIVAAASEPAPEPLQTKSAEPPAPSTMKEFLQLHGKKPATYEALDVAVDVVMDVVAKGLKERVEPLKQAVAELQARVLELEAQRAATAPVGER